VTENEMIDQPIDYRPISPTEKPTKHSRYAIGALLLLLLGIVIHVVTVCLAYQWITYRWDRLYARVVGPFHIVEGLLIIYLFGCALGIVGVCEANRKRSIAWIALVGNALNFFFLFTPALSYSNPFEALLFCP